MASLLYVSPPIFPLCHRAGTQPQIYALTSDVMWHRNPSISCTKGMITSQGCCVGFFSPVMIEKCSNLKKTPEKFSLYVTADLVTVCIGSSVQTWAEKEKQSMEKARREATSRHSSASVLLKQRNRFLNMSSALILCWNSLFEVFQGRSVEGYQDDIYSVKF